MELYPYLSPKAFICWQILLIRVIVDLTFALNQEIYLIVDPNEVTRLLDKYYPKNESTLDDHLVVLVSINLKDWMVTRGMTWLTRQKDSNHSFC